MGKTESKPAKSSAASGASVPLDELAREQGVAPVANLDQLGALWPAEDDPDAFLAFVKSERALGRAAASTKARKSA
jgi:hypothetical protein